MKELVTKIIQRWFLSEPPLFRAMCLFSLQENCGMACAVRIGAKDKAVMIGMESLEITSSEKGMRRLEYNPDLLKEMTEQEIAEHFKCEMIRVLLKHPYERMPEGCSLEVCALGSNVVVGDNYRFRFADMPRAGFYGLEKGQAYEWYCLQIQQMCNNQTFKPGDNGVGTPDSSQLHDLASEWQEDQFMCESVNSVIRQCEESDEWGSMGGALIEKIKAGARAKINWRTILCGFKASILSSRRRLTRMRPSRRFEFEQMGSLREFDTKLLVAMDVSGSIASKTISQFLGVINSIFKYGVQQVDVAQFDVDITTTITLKRALETAAAVGRGGTSFQPVIDYAVKKGYNGIVLLTDGYAEHPVLPKGSSLKLAWVCTDEYSYNEHHEWMEKMGRVCIMDIK